MAKETVFKIKKKRVYQVQCPFDPAHVFEKKFEFKDGVTGPPPETVADVFCPFCAKMVTIKVKGEFPRNEEMDRLFKEQDERLAGKKKR